MLVFLSLKKELNEIRNQTLIWHLQTIPELLDSILEGIPLKLLLPNNKLTILMPGGGWGAENGANLAMASDRLWMCLGCSDSPGNLEEKVSQLEAMLKKLQDDLQKVPWLSWIFSSFKNRSLSELPQQSLQVGERI